MNSRIANPNGMQGQARNAGFPNYPTKWLPAPMLAQLDMRGSLSAAGIGSAMLGCGSSASMNARLDLDDGAIDVPSTLWVPLIGENCAATNACHEIVYEPYKRREVVEAERYAAEMETWTSLDMETRKERGLRQPMNRSRLTDDLTIEVLVRRLKANGGAIAIYTDELPRTLTAVGQHEKGYGENEGQLMSLWSGQTWVYDRVGLDPDSLIHIYISKPVLPIYGTIQPHLVGLLGDPGSGMLARWLPHYCEEPHGTKLGHMADEWEAAVKVLLGEMHRARTWTMPADCEAGIEHLAARKRWKTEARDVSQNTASTNFLKKAGEHSARIALVLAEIGAAGDVATGATRQLVAGEIPVWAMRAAIDLVDYCAAVWRAPRSIGALARKPRPARQQPGARSCPSSWKTSRI